MEETVRSLHSPFDGTKSPKWTCFAYFGVTRGEPSLLLRLAGGEGGIRIRLKTPNKGLSSARTAILIHVSL
jgi:hypothetical protein